MIKELIKKNKPIYGFFRRIQKGVLNTKRNARILLDHSLAPIDELMGALKRVAYYVDFVRSKQYDPAILADTIESKYIIEQGMNWGFIPPDVLVVCKEVDPPKGSRNYMDYTADWTNKAHSLVVPRMFCYDDYILYEIYSDLRSRGKKVAIFDQVPTVGGTWLLKTQRIYR